MMPASLPMVPCFGWFKNYEFQFIDEHCAVIGYQIRDEAVTYLPPYWSIRLTHKNQAQPIILQSKFTVFIEPKARYDNVKRDAVFL